MAETMARIKALDLFAGTGWGVACQWLGIKEMGVEIMPEAVETRTANGMETVYRDVWDGLELSAEDHRKRYGSYQLLIASPPCQTFSMAGNGKGRDALNEVLEAIELHAYKDAVALREFGDRHDPRTALVLSPLAYVWRDRPRLVAMEQVPQVLPVWEACAEVMREWGYEVKTEVLNAEQYGVPQTRKRAILVARRGGDVHLPAPTHSRYYTNKPEKLDPGVRKWVSMAEALGWVNPEGWGFRDRPALTVTNSVGRGLSGGGGAMRALHGAVRDGSFIPSPHGDGSDVMAEQFRITDTEAGILQSYPPYAVKNMGSGMVERYGDRPGRSTDAPAFTVRASAGGTEPGGFVLQDEDGETRKLEAGEAAALQSYPPYVSYTQNNRLAHQSVRGLDQPAPTVTAGHDSGNRGFYDADGGFTIANPEQVAALQSYPSAPVFRGGNQAHATRRELDQPAPTLHFGARSNKVEWMDPALAGDPAASGERVTVEQASTLQSYPAYVRSNYGTGGDPANRGERLVTQPAPTITSKADRNKWDGEDGVTQEQAAALQTYPGEPPFIWCGSKSKKFLQIGNAVPPVLAEAVLAALIGIRPGR